ncbi:MAG: hypothetical protein GWM87_12760 [Xanthomonadales bacterium]|nr:hypothetical protein [Xanthomonadales bacterium]NIX13706.1 hypothetical protein [Xanthomonadales bacterium]
MKKQMTLLLPAALFALTCAVSATAGDAAGNMEKKVVIALQADDFELGETDISDLAVGESETIVTESGRTIDILRTGDGFELYVDGELLETGTDGAHGDHFAVHKRVEIICEGDDDCDETVWIGDEAELAMLHEDHAADGEHGVVTRRIRVECEDGEECEKHRIWIASGEDADFETLIEDHGEAHGMVVIRKVDGEHGVEVLTDGEAVHESGHDADHGGKVIIVKKKIRKQDSG